VRVIGLTGKAHAGKDTSCGLIQAWGERQGIEVIRAAFADKLKESAAACFGIPADRAVAWCDWLKHDVFIDVREAPDAAAARRGGEGVVRETITGREFLQRYGTEAHRDIFGVDFWVDALLVRREARPDDFGKLLVISDVRFENEARAIHNVGGEVWEVVRDDNPDVLAQDLAAHASESGIPDYLIHRTILNNGDLDHLERKVGIACVEALR
jgi:hypothetical protein